jgi:hypothetical protein
MPAKLRVAKDRRPSFSAETLALFIELEHMPRNRRGFNDKSKRLANLLGLSDAWWGGCDVHDRSHEPSHPPEYAAHHYWHHVRAVRAELLAATGLVSFSNRQGGRHAGQATNS